MGIPDELYVTGLASSNTALFKLFWSLLKNFIFVGYEFFELGSRYVFLLPEFKKLYCVE